jgi:hypothetical protein
MIYSRVRAVHIALTKHFEELIERPVASGRYNNSSEVAGYGVTRNKPERSEALILSTFPGRSPCSMLKGLKWLTKFKRSLGLPQPNPLGDS